MSLWTMVMDFSVFIVSAGLTVFFIVGSMIEYTKAQDEPVRAVAEKVYDKEATH